MRLGLILKFQKHCNTWIVYLLDHSAYNKHVDIKFSAHAAFQEQTQLRSILTTGTYKVIVEPVLDFSYSAI